MGMSLSMYLVCVESRSISYVNVFMYLIRLSSFTMVDLCSTGGWRWKACPDTIHGSYIQTAICNFHWWGISLMYWVEKLFPPAPPLINMTRETTIKENVYGEYNYRTFALAAIDHLRICSLRTLFSNSLDGTLAFHWLCFMLHSERNS